jgi:two-component system, response regulator PdtaR
MHALIIEDELLIALDIEDAVQALNYHSCDHAHSVSDAVRLAELRCPDLILADHRIIGGTGTDAVLVICAVTPVPVVFVTASCAEVRERVPSATIVEKPFRTCTLHAAVDHAVAHPFVLQSASAS